VTPTGGRETVLLVEDEDLLRDVIAAILRDRGYTVLVACDGVEALAHSTRHPGPIDLVLTDVVLPQLGGPALADRVVAQRPDTRVLYMSGHTDDRIERHGVERAHAAFLQKPFRPDDLARKVREVLDGGAGAERLY
jgi:CheY-like chemotaxis protein